MEGDALRGSSWSSSRDRSLSLQGCRVTHFLQSLKDDGDTRDALIMYPPTLHFFLMNIDEGMKQAHYDNDIDDQRQP
jgi:hypothetical protein